jgi:two-component system, cell cycle sensor histidine kinase and response regulator CckA
MSELPKTVLVTDDERAGVYLVATILSRRGYRVLTACSGPEALNVLAAENGCVDLVITDVVMPEMSGVQLAQAIGDAYPAVPILFISGFSGHVLEGVQTRRFLCKPLVARELIRVVDELTAGGNASPV